MFQGLPAFGWRRHPGCLAWWLGSDVFWGAGVHGHLAGRDQSGGWVASLGRGTAETAAKLSAGSPYGGIRLAPRVALATHLIHLLSQHDIQSVLAGWWRGLLFMFGGDSAITRWSHFLIYFPSPQ